MLQSALRASPGLDPCLTDKRISVMLKQSEGGGQGAQAGLGFVGFMSGDHRPDGKKF